MNEFARQALQKRLNYVKLIFLFLDVGASVLVRTFEILYKGPKPPETHLVELSNVKCNGIFPAEKKTLELLKDGEMKLGSLDITLLYKLIQASCGLIDKTTREGKLLWSKNCPKEQRGCMEFLLFKYKDIRNEIIHDFRKLEKLTDNSFHDIKMNSESLLLNIINEVGRLAELSPKDTMEWQRKLREDMNFICQWNLIDEELGSRSIERSFSEEEEKECFEASFQSEITPNYGYRSRSGNFSSPKCVPNNNEERESNNYTAKSGSNVLESLLNLGIKNKKSIKGYQIKRDILDRNGGEMLMKASEWMMDNAFPITKSDRKFWITRLLTTNVLDDDASLQQFLKEYSKEQNDIYGISKVFDNLKIKCGF